MNFVNRPTINDMYEASITKMAYDWVGNIAEDIDDTWWFTVTYLFNQIGRCVDANIAIQRKIDGKWVKCGDYTASIKVPFVSLKCACIVPTDEGSNIVSQPLHYYVDGYYDEGYYV